MKEIPLTKGYTALVDDEDYERLCAYSWQAQVRSHAVNPCVYARRAITTHHPDRRKKQRVVFMHAEILGIPKADHKDGNGLNNQKINLRPGQGWRNGANSRKAAGKSSKYKGVTWAKEQQKWKATAGKDRKVFNLGYFKDEVDAAQAYNFMAFELFGEFALLNTPTVA